MGVIQALLVVGLLFFLVIFPNLSVEIKPKECTFQCGQWGECINNQRIRMCEDDCGNKKTDSSSCNLLGRSYSVNIYSLDTYDSYSFSELQTIGEGIKKDINIASRGFLDVNINKIEIVPMKSSQVYCTNIPLDAINPSYLIIPPEYAHDSIQFNGKIIYCNGKTAFVLRGNKPIDSISATSTHEFGHMWCEHDFGSNNIMDYGTNRIMDYGDICMDRIISDNCLVICH